MEAGETTQDPRRWLALGLVLLAVVLPVIDNTVLTVSVPRIMADLDTDITGAQWLFTTYALVFASGLVIAGRLGDMHGPRRMVIIGSVLFGTGSLIAALAPTLPIMIVGLGAIEGMGAALLVPNTTSLIARTFHGRERVTAFAAHAMTIGAAASIAPLLGGYLTTYHSWRWAFGVNVIVAPIVILGLLSTTTPDGAKGDRQRLDVRGALLIASGTFLVVFGLSQGETYGWWRPTGALTIAGRDVWPATAPISIVPLALIAGVALIVVFYRAEVALERRDAHPLFEFSQFRHRTFRLANLATFFMAFGQLGVAISVSLFLQESRGMTPLENGLWVFPSGLAILAGAPFGGWASRRIGAVNTMRIGGTLTVVNLLLIAAALSSDVPYVGALPWFLLYGFGSGMVASQLTRVMLNDIAPHRAGAASGINMAARQTATALGVATIGTIFATVAANSGIHAALWPAMGTAACTLAVSVLVIWRIPRIEPDAQPTDVLHAEDLVATDLPVGPVTPALER
jgi:EmrB/QacA subfamily drug resistance transporter